MVRPVRLTRHAEAMLAERGLDLPWQLRVLRPPSSDEPDPAKPGRRRAFGLSPERDGRTRRVVYEPGDHVTVTAFLDRGRSA